MDKIDIELCSNCDAKSFVLYLRGIILRLEPKPWPSFCDIDNGTVRKAGLDKMFLPKSVRCQNHSLIYKGDSDA